MKGLRLALTVGLAVAVLVSPFPGAAQQPVKIARIGYLATDLAAGDPRYREAFLQGLRDLGYVEGRNVVIEYRDAKGKPERFPALAAELVTMKVDVIVSTGGSAGTLAARQATTTVPIVFTAVGDPVADRLVKSSRSRAAMSLGCQSSPRSSWPNGWNSSRRPCRASVWSPFSGGGIPSLTRPRETS